MSRGYSSRKVLLYPLMVLFKGLTGTNFNRFNGWLYQRFFPHYEYNGLRFDYPKGASSRARSGGFFFDAYEKQERQLVERYLASEARVLELGGCIGFISCLTNRRLSTEAAARHTVVEANPVVIPYLKRNRDLNNCRFQVIQGVVSNKPAGFHVNREDFLASHLGSEGEPVETVAHFAYDDLPCADEYDTWIMDIEGAEVAFIEENQSVLPSIRILIVEMHPHKVDSARINLIPDTLAKHGFFRKEKRATVEVWVSGNSRKAPA